MKLKNVELSAMLSTLDPILERNDILGYLAARNTKLLKELLEEYEQFREELIFKYGHRDTDEEGNELPTISIHPGDKNFDKYAKEMEKIMNVEQEFTPVIGKYDDAVGILSGREILDLDWMFHD